MEKIDIKKYFLEHRNGHVTQVGNRGKLEIEVAKKVNEIIDKLEELNPTLN